MRKLYFSAFAILTGFAAQSQIINFPDANFKAKLLQPYVAYDASENDLTIDANGDGEIEVGEAQLVNGLDVSNAGISDLTGISYFTGMHTLRCNNNTLTVLDIDAGVTLSVLDASHNALTSVNVHHDTWMEGLDLSYNNLTSYSVDSGTYFEKYNLSHNQINSLTLNDAIFDNLDVSYNNLSSIQANGNVVIAYYGNFSNNQFSLLDFTDIGFSYDTTITFGNNVVDRVVFGTSPGNIGYTSDNTFFDMGNFTSVGDCEPDDHGHVYISNCPNLNYFILKNGFNHTTYTCNEGGTIFSNPAMDLNISNCPNLSFICVDEGERPNIQARINQLGLQNQVQVNSYCSFTPGGTYYTVNGVTRTDQNADGCDSADSPVPFQQFTIAGGGDSGTVISNASGNYAIYVGPGAHTITPILQNPGIYTVSPASMTVDFPSDPSPYNQNFCLTPNSVYPDLEISIVPIIGARPGFDAQYKILYRNKGNQIQSGTVNLTFNDAVSDFVSATPANTSQTTNTLIWDFSNLQPFESREITVILNVNAPTETPAVNAGDVLAYSASITNTLADETPADNTANVNQIVVNSIDPNDKTCVEGNTVGPEMIGQFVHYIVRFENTGTANAQNIVVEDLIDTSKFDPATLVPLSGSAPFTTRISDTNKVEFIFENINLPFDDTNNDGYIAFKIKTMPTLIVGDTFANNASIYFDYNFPVVTNTATTMVQLLGTPDFDFSDHFTLSPNPTKNILDIHAKDAILLKSIAIYNVLGQLVLAVPNAENLDSVDVSNLKTGNYFVKIHSDSGAANTQFIKE